MIERFAVQKTVSLVSMGAKPATTHTSPLPGSPSPGLINGARRALHNHGRSWGKKAATSQTAVQPEPSVQSGLWRVLKRIVEDAYRTVRAALVFKRSNTSIWVILIGCFLIFVITLRHRRKRRNRPPVICAKSGEPYSHSDGFYDVCIVGAGPSGATCAYFLARAGKHVLLLEKQRLPRDKVCGDVVSPAALEILREMGILEEIIAEQCGKWGNTSGFVSPNGSNFISELPGNERFMAIQRIVLDEQVANAAVRAGATLLDGTEVESIAFDAATGQWTIALSIHGLDGEHYTYRATAVVAADGAESRLARQQGVVGSGPDSLGSRSFAKAGTHRFRASHAAFYPARLLPGFFVVSHELEDFLNLSCFGFGRPSPDALARLYAYCVHEDPYITKALGPNVVITPMKCVPLRVGGVEKSYADHFLVVGDAAGQVDPLTGAGLQYGMTAGKIAAATLLEGFAARDLSEDFLARYHKRWQSAFGWDLWVSCLISKLITRFPCILDAAAAVIQRKGEEFLSSWALVMTGTTSKLWFLRPNIGLLILFEAALLWVKERWSAARSSQTPRSDGATPASPPPDTSLIS